MDMPGRYDHAKALTEHYHARKRIHIDNSNLGTRKRIPIDNSNSDTDDVEEELEENVGSAAIIVSTRISKKRPGNYRNKGIDADETFRNWINDSRYLLYTHMTRSSFEFVHDMIKDDAIFINSAPKSPSKQRSVFFQLFITLSRLVGYGEGWSFDKVCESFNVGHGTVPTYTERVCTAIGRHADRWIQWPTDAARKDLSALAEAQYGFPGFIASCDGTLIGLRRAPVVEQHPEMYHIYHHHCNGGYGFKVLFWVDHHGSIIHSSSNWPASASFQAILDSTHFAQNPWQYLKCNEEYVFVNVSFKPDVFAVPPYDGKEEKNFKEGKKEVNALFNRAQRKTRVKVGAHFVVYLFSSVFR
jgi:hypothetical protein